jgi:hypothetical protein
MWPLAITRLDSHTADGMLRPYHLNSKTTTFETVHSCLLWGYIKEFHAQACCSYELKQPINASAEVVIYTYKINISWSQLLTMCHSTEGTNVKIYSQKLPEFTFIYILFLQSNMNWWHLRVGNILSTNTITSWVTKFQNTGFLRHEWDCMELHLLQIMPQNAGAVHMPIHQGLRQSILSCACMQLSYLQIVIQELNQSFKTN